MILKGKSAKAFIDNAEANSENRNSVDFSKEVESMKKIMAKGKRKTLLDFQFGEDGIKHGDWVYTPNEVFGSGGKQHNIFQYDERINYSTDFSCNLIFYKLKPKQ